MVCPNCGAENAPDARFCGNCGTVMEPAPAAEIPAEAVGVIPGPVPELTRREALLCVKKSAKSNIVFAAVVCFISAVLTIGLNLLSASLSAGIIIEEALVVLLGILLLTTKRVWAAVLLLVYGIVNTGIYWYATGTPGGWLLIIAGILAVIGTSQCAKVWKNYKKQRRETAQ